MIRYGVKWNDSQSKIIYKATKHSEYLMQHLENKLFDSGLIKETGDQPNGSPKRQYGVMKYYYRTKPNRVLLTSAPRREHNHIHVEIISQVVNHEALVNAGFSMGRNLRVPDLLVSSESEIDRLVGLILLNNFRLK